MLTRASKRLPLRRQLALWTVISTVLLALESVASASCGDYLLHEPPSNTGHSHLQSNRPFFPEGMATFPMDDHPSGPSSACEGGRCHRAPLAPPVDSPRILVPKQFASVIGVADASAGCMTVNWMRPTDGEKPAVPFLEIASPPPRHV